MRSFTAKRLLRLCSARRPLCKEATGALILTDTEEHVLETETPAAEPQRSPKHRSHFEGIGFTEEEYKQMMERFPGLDRVSLQQPVVKKLDFLSEKGMSRRGMVRFFASVLNVYPEFLDLDLEKDIRPVFDYLSSLDLSEEEVLVMMIQYPHLVGYDVEEVFRTKVDFLRGLDLEASDIVRILFSFPQIFGVSLESNIEPVVTYLTQEMDLGRKDLKKIFRKFPQILGLRLSATRAKLDFLIETGFDLPTIRALTKRFPAFLRTSLRDDLRPTMELLLEYTSKENMREIFYKCPQCLCMSYEQDILPKFLFFTQMGYDPVDMEVLLEKFPEVLCYSLVDEIMPAVQESINVGLSLLETRITFAREPELFRQAIAKVTKDIDQQEKQQIKQLQP